MSLRFYIRSKFSTLIYEEKEMKKWDKSSTSVGLYICPFGDEGGIMCFRGYHTMDNSLFAFSSYPNPPILCKDGSYFGDLVSDLYEITMLKTTYSRYFGGVEKTYLNGDDCCSIYYVLRQMADFEVL